MTPQRIMLVDNEEGLCRMMEAVLMDQGYQVKSFTRPVQAVAEFSAGDYELIISDIKMPEMDGLEVLQHIRNRDPEVPVIMITAYATVEMSIQALRRGAYDMLTKPFEPDELVYRVKNALQHHELLEENHELREELSGQFRFENIIGASPVVRALLEKVAKVAIRDTSVLITGESGTGKELVARAIHFDGPRGRQPFVEVNCAAIPGNLLAEGTMLVNTAVRQWKPAQTLEYFVPEAIAFQVIDSFEGDSARGQYPGDLAGVVRPKLEWRTERTGDAE